MPKPLTPEEKTSVMDTMYRKGIQLIRTKKLKKITVEDITSAAGIAKGTFYVYYKSKEEFLYQLIKRFETELMRNIVAAASCDGDLKTKVTYIFKNIYLAADSIAFSLAPEDVQWLLQKLPEKSKPEREKSQNNLVQIFEALGIPTAKCKSTTIHYLSDCLLHISSSQLVYYDEAGKNEAMDIMIKTIADYICRLADEQGIKEGIKVFYFHTNTHSMRVSQYKSNSKANLYFCDKRFFRGVMLVGTMEVLEDAAHKEMLWQEGDTMYYSLGVTDPDYCILKFTATKGRFYSNFSSESFEIE